MRVIPRLTLCLCLITAATAYPLDAQAQSAGTSLPSLRDLFRQTLTDFQRLPSRQTLTILSVGAMGAGIGRMGDAEVSRAMGASSALDAALRPGETLGGVRMQTAAALATYTIGRLTGSDPTTRIGGDLIRAHILTQAMTAGIKLSVRRGRPDGTRFSFPSGHASSAFATATVLQRHLGWKVGIPAYGFATYIAASRIQDRRHFLSDVTFGAAVGIVAGRTVTIGRGGVRFRVAPAPAPGGGAVAFTWVGR